MAERVFSYEFRGKFDNLRDGLAAGGKSVSDFGNKLTALDKQGARMRAGLTQLGGTAGRIGLTAAAGLGAIVVATANFDKAMSSVAATGDDARASFDELRKAAIQAGADTAFSATEAAGAIEALAKAGVSSADILNGGLSGALDLAAAGSLDVATAAEIAATTLTQFNLSGDQATRVADVLAAAAGKAQGEVTDMAGALKYVGPVAAQMGLSVEEAGGAIALLASQGILGEQAGTSLRGMLTSLTSPSKVAAKEMEALGISMYDAQGQFIGLDGIAGQLQERMSGLTEAERNEALGRIFGNEQITAARILYAGGAEAVQDWTRQVDDSGFAAETAATKLDNLSGDLEALKGSLETALIGAGSGSQGPLRKLVQGLTEGVNAFNDLPPAAQNTATALLGITAITGGAAWFGSKVVMGIADTKQALSDLGWTSGKTSVSLEGVAKMAGRLVAVAGAVSLLGEAVSKASGASLDGNDLQRNLEAIANGAGDDTINRITSDIEMLGSTINSAAEPLQEAGRLFGVFGDTGLDKASANIESVDQALASMVESGNAEQAAKIFDQIMSAATGVEAGTMNFAPGIGEAGEKFDSYATALDNSSTAASGATSANADLATATDGAAAAAADNAAEQEAQAKALADARKEAQSTAQQFFNLGDSLNDSKTSLREWIRDMQRSADDLRNFRVNAEKAADNGLRKGLIAALQEAGPEGARRMRQLANATDEEIARANRAWSRGQKEVNRYTDAVGGVPAKATTKVEVDGVTSGISLVRQLSSSIKNIADRTVWITTRHRVVGSVTDALPARGGAPKASGGPIVGPGGPTSDDVPIMASNGEFMMSAKAVRHYGLDTMFAMNARHLASGGSVDGIKDRPGGRAGISIDTDDLRRKLKSWTRELAVSEKALAAETKQRDSLIQQRDSVRSSVAGGLRQDLWATENPWSATGSGPTGRANAVTATASEFTKLVTALRAKGLDGPALAEAAASGDISRLRLLNSMSAADLNAFEAAINAQESALRAAGVATSGAMGLDSQAAAATAQVKALESMTKSQEKTIKLQTKALEAALDALPKGIGREINGAASRGDRGKRRDRSTK